MRGYFLGNMYLSSIQQGIQCAHTTTELFVKATIGSFSSTQEEYLYEWSTNHKTKILLNGGFASNLRNIQTFLESPDNPYPWAYFEESEDALEGTITCVGIILPERVYQNIGNSMDFDAQTAPTDEFEQALVEELSKYPLA